MCGDGNLTAFMCRPSRNSGSQKLLEPSGHIQACTEIALPLTVVKASVTLNIYKYRYTWADHLNPGLIFFVSE